MKKSIPKLRSYRPKLKSIDNEKISAQTLLSEAKRISSIDKDDFDFVGFYIMAWDKYGDTEVSIVWDGGEENYINKSLLPEMARNRMRSALIRNGDINL